MTDMRKPSSLLPLSVLSIGAVLGACSSDPPSPTSVRSHITSDLGNVLHESAAAGDGASNMVPTGSFDLFSRVLGQSGGASTQTLVAKMNHSLVEGEANGFDPDAIIEQLNTTIFTDQNEVEAGIYAVPADLVCTESTWDSNGVETTVVDPECAANWNKLALRIRVEENGSTLTFAVQLGAGHDEPLEISLTHTSLAVSVDLDEAEDAAAAIASALGEEAPNANLAGKINGKLTLLGTAHAQVSLDIDRAVAVAVAENGADLAGADAFRLTSAAAHVFEVDLDGSAGIGAFALGLGATTAHIPGEDSFDLDLPGASADVTLTANQPLHINHIGLGDRTTTLSRNGAIGLAIDLNPANGRAFDATITFDQTAGTETISVSPKLDANIMTNHIVLGEDASRYDVTRVLLDGSLRGTDGSDQVEVLTGSFSISTNPAQYGFSATAGQCVAGEDVLDSTSGDYFTQWTAGTCQ
ncbi:hypothetical protein BH11MYX3_BH11MYX3_48340 [soil metagenome]